MSSLAKVMIYTVPVTTFSFLLNIPKFLETQVKQQQQRKESIFYFRGSARQLKVFSATGSSLRVPTYKRSLSFDSLTKKSSTKKKFDELSFDVEKVRQSVIRQKKVRRSVV
jgi:hypothetical protein